MDDENATGCNGCAVARLKHSLGDKFLALKPSRWRYVWFALRIRWWETLIPSLLGKEGWTQIYEIDQEPAEWDDKPLRYHGRPTRWIVGLPSVEHSDACYNWQPPQKGDTNR